MFRRVFLTAIASGIAAGLALSLVQTITIIPLILEAEIYESASAEQPSALATAAMAAQVNEARDWAPADGIERSFFTTLANVLTAVGFALLLAACFALHGKPMGGSRGVLWGLAGFAAFSLAPALGLPPELPGMAAAELTARQGWWLLTVTATAAGLWFLVLGPGRWMPAVGIVVLAAPHLIGAPHTESLGGGVPAELAAHFVAASLATMAVFWAILGWTSGTLFQRLAPAT